MTAKSDKRILWGSLLLFGQQGATIAAESLINFGLIDSYEPGIFVYFYAIAAVISSTLILLSQFVIRKHQRRYVFILYATIILSFLSWILLIYFGISGIVFATTINFIAALDLIGIANNTSIFTAFNIQELHRVTKKFTISSSVATIFFCLLLPFLIETFGAVVLLEVSVALYVACWLSVANLKPLTDVAIDKAKNHANPFSFPLFRLIILFSIFSWSSLTFIDYALKMALMKAFTGNTVGTVSALFLGFVALAVILTQVLGAPSLVERLGGLNLLIFTPVIVGLFGTLVFIVPSTVFVFLMYFVQSTYVLGICYVGTQMLLNSIPRKAHFHARSLLLIVALLVADVVIVPAFFFICGEQIGEKFIVLAALVCLGLSSLVVARIKRLYPRAMKTRVEQPRFFYFRNFVSDENLKDEDIGKLVPQIGHRYSVEAALSFLQRTHIDPVPLLTVNLPAETDVLNFQGRVRVLARLPGEHVERHLAGLLDCKLAVLPQALPYAISMRSLSGVGGELKNCVSAKLSEEAELIKLLKGALIIETSDVMQPELTSRLDLAKRRFFYYLAAISQNPRSVLNVLPRILDETFVKVDEVRKADAIDYLSVVTEDSRVRKVMHDVLSLQTNSITKMEYETLIRDDHWLSKIRDIRKLTFGENMNDIEKALFLSRVKLFEPLPAEMLELIANSVREEALPSNARIFAKGDEVDKVYMVVAGEVEVRTNQTTVDYGRFGLFGEIGMLGCGLRTADAVAISDVKMLVIEKQEFLQLLEDVPEVAKELIKLLTSYLERISS